MKNKECNYVQDLLPNYIENLTTSDTNCLLEEHLRSCKGCSKALNSMKREVYCAWYFPYFYDNCY